MAPAGAMLHKGVALTSHSAPLTVASPTLPVVSAASEVLEQQRMHQRVSRADVAVEHSSQSACVSLRAALHKQRPSSSCPLPHV